MAMVGKRNKNGGAALHSLGRFEEAVASVRRALVVLSGLQAEVVRLSK
jgi:hypothetical protein